MAADAGTSSTPDGSVADTPPVDPGAPDAGDLELLTSAPAAPSVDTTCDASSVQAAPPGRHPGACNVLDVENSELWVNITTDQRTYSAQGVVTDRQQRWGSSSDGKLADYTLTVVDNSWNAQGRAERSVKREWYLPNGSSPGYANWSSTVFGYQAGGYSASTWVTGHSADADPIPPPVMNHQQDFVFDARGTAITTRDYAPVIGNDEVVTVTFYPDGMEYSESWDGWFNPYSHESGETHIFDESGNLVESDSLYFRGGYGEDKSQVTYTYSQGWLTRRRIDNSHYPTWDTNLRLSDEVTDETYTYDGAMLRAMDSSEIDETCGFTFDPPYITSCSSIPGPRRHTSYSYDSSGNLASRVVTDEVGNELSRYTAVSDADGNLLCESQSQGGALQTFSRYDYSCWQ